MKKINFLILLLLGAFFVACDSKVDTSVKEVKFDREVCERCKMIISDRNYVVQIVNQQDGKRYYYDDIGCAILWFKEKQIKWAEQATIYVADAKTGKWIDAKKAFWTYGAVTPMNFGFSAYEQKQADVENYDYKYVESNILGQNR